MIQKTVSSIPVSPYIFATNFLIASAWDGKTSYFTRPGVGWGEGVGDEFFTHYCYTRIQNRTPAALINYNFDYS